ncbi:MAG: hypothetical protein JRN15_02510 [Nitrososphaerota archaeon]|nr:hypothetical protein [Nitrososphaerota archaeon]
MPLVSWECPAKVRLYISVKKSPDTVGGQDFEGAVKRLEKLAKSDKNVTSPYICVIAVATSKGKIASYKQSRKMRRDSNGRLYSTKSEQWGPGFIYPYITGKPASYIYKEAEKLVNEYYPFYSLQFKDECSKLLKDELVRRGVAKEDGTIAVDDFLSYVAKEQPD